MPSLERSARAEGGRFGGGGMVSVLGRGGGGGVDVVCVFGDFGRDNGIVEKDRMGFGVFPMRVVRERR